MAFSIVEYVHNYLIEAKYEIDCTIHYKNETVAIWILSPCRYGFSGGETMYRLLIVEDDKGIAEVESFSMAGAKWCTMLIFCRSGRDGCTLKNLYEYIKEESNVRITIEGSDS